MKRKSVTDLNIESPSVKRCRTPITLLRTERESAKNRELSNIFNFNTLTKIQSDPAGEARSEHSDLSSQGVGDDAVFFDNSDSPEAPARAGFVLHYGRCTASLVGDQSNLTGQ